jgi:hypothetical protein
MGMSSEKNRPVIKRLEYDRDERRLIAVVDTARTLQQAGQSSMRVAT